MIVIWRIDGAGAGVGIQRRDDGRQVIMMSLELNQRRALAIRFLAPIWDAKSASPAASDVTA